MTNRDAPELKLASEELMSGSNKQMRIALRTATSVIKHDTGNATKPNVRVKLDCLIERGRSPAWMTPWV